MEQFAFPKYKQYKPSGVDWLGHIPDSWSIERIRAVTELKSKNNQPDLPVLSVYREYGVIPKDSRDDNHNATSLDTSNYKVVECGDLVVNKMKAWQGSMGVSEHQGIVSPAYITCAVDAERVFPKFLHYLLRSRPYIGVYNSLSYGVRVGQWDMHYEDFKHIPLPIPGKVEQQRIASFLDQKTAEIDEAITKKQRLIELLKEQKTILINQAVTNGLNPDVPMRDSGVEWIGEVPEHWGVKRLKHLIDFLPGFAFKSEQYSADDTDVPLLRGININPGQLNWQEVVYWPKEKLKRYEQYKLCEGDYVIGMDRPWVSDGIRVARVDENDLPCLLLQRVGRLRAREELVNGYMGLLLRSEAFLAYFEPMLSGISVPHISPEQIGNFASAFPPELEQQAIYDFAQRVTIEFDELVSKEMRSIQAIQEYKSVLVANAVTGKIRL